MPADSRSRADYEPSVNWFRLLPTIGVAIVAIAIPSVILDYAKWKPHAHATAPVTSGSLGLHVATRPDQMEIFWDHNSSAIRGAEKATLRISDGDVTEAVPFEYNQLQDGSLVYRPRTNDVSVRMEVVERDGRQVSQSVRAVTTP